jgi:DNA (cytosine-5)-methyltransferase 1
MTEIATQTTLDLFPTDPPKSQSSALTHPDPQEADSDLHSNRNWTDIPPESWAKPLLRSDQAEGWVPARRSPFTFADLFAGIGGFRIPLERLGGQCMAYAEIDREAIATYQSHFPTTTEQALGDLTQVQALPNQIDLLVGGVPCQAWSIAGLTRGFADPRGQLWFDVCRLVTQSQPRGFLFENVKGLAEPRHRNSLEYLLNQFSQAGYCVYWTILNSYDFGLPQDRDRLFIVGLHRSLPRANQFQFPPPSPTVKRLCEVLKDLPQDQTPKQKFPVGMLFGDRIPGARGRFQADDELNDFFLLSDVRDGHTTIHSWDILETTEREKSICMTLLRNRRKKKYGPKDGNPLHYDHFRELISDLQFSELEALVQKKILRPVQDRFDFVNSRISTGIHGVSRIFLPRAQAMGTLTARGSKDFVATRNLAECCPVEFKQTFIESIYLPGHFRALTADDYRRLQGFPDTFQCHPKAAIAKKQFGNAVSIPVVEAIASQLLAYLVVAISH